MKTVFVKILIYIVRWLLNAEYAVMRHFPAKKNKILFCSRLGNEPSLDFILIQKSLEGRNFIFVNECVHVSRSSGKYIIFALKSVVSVYHMATCRLCILDSYWPAASMLSHKDDLKIIQIWHSIGKIKQTSYQTLGKKSGRKAEYAGVFRMHKNYDYVIAGAPYWNKYYCESFHVDESVLLNYGLPRIDYLLDTEAANIRKFYSEFPQFKGKTIILYAPTFRRKMKSGWKKIIEAARGEDFILIIKTHHLETDKHGRNEKNIIYPDNWNTLDLLAVCDYFITDYSASALEAAVLRRRTYYWTYDYDEYMENNGLNLDLKKNAGKYLFEDINELIADIKRGEYDDAFIEDYRAKYLPAEMGNSTEKIDELILKIMKVSV